MKVSKLFIIAAAALLPAIPAHADDSGMTAVRVGEGADDMISIRPGAYLTVGARQLRVSDRLGRVTMFKGQLPGGQASLTVLNDGDTLEYSGVICLTLTDADYKYDPLVTNAAVLDPLRCFSIRQPSFVQLSDGGRTEIDGGAVRIYNRFGELCREGYSGYTGSVSGYILNAGYSGGEAAQSAAPKTVLELYENVRYTVGVEIEAGNYLGTGSGTVRVYNTEGDPKTVIKLSPGKREGVESYTFGLHEGETIMTEGSISLQAE